MNIQDPNPEDIENIPHQETVDTTGPSNLVKPAQDRFDKAKSFSLMSDPSFLNVHNYVDAKDQVNNWCVAQVVANNIDDGSVQLSFEGWSSRYDVLLKKNSTKMCAFRSHSFGYTGQTKSAYRDFKVNPAYQAIITKRINDVISSEFTCFESPYACTQFIRGELFFYVDSMITLSSVISSDDLPVLIDLMRQVFELTLTWLKIFPAYKDSYRESKSNTNLYCVDLPTAIANCGPELADMLGRCIGGMCRRANQLFIKHGTQYLVPGNFCKQDQAKRNGFMMSLVNTFGNMNGFARMREYLARGVNQESGECDEDEKIPMQIIQRFLHQFVSIQQNTTPTFATQFAIDASMLLKNRIQNLSEVEIKELEKEVPHNVIRIMSHYCGIYQEQDQIYEISEKYQLALAKKYLFSPFFEKRIRGMNEFKEVFVKVQNKHTKSQQQLNNEKCGFTQYLNYDIYAQWLTEQGILEFIFVDKPHQELIKRSLELLFVRTRSETYALTPELIAAIWNCCTEKHEDVMRASLTALEQLVPYVDLEGLETIFKHINETPESEYNELHVNFLKNYTINALTALQGHQTKLTKATEKKGQDETQKQKVSYGKSITNFFSKGEKGEKGKKQEENRIDSSKYLNMGQFWVIAQETNETVPWKTKKQSLGCLISILNSKNAQHQLMNQQTKLDFIHMAMENIVGNRSINMSINFLKRLIRTFQLESQINNQQSQQGYRPRNEKKESKKLNNGSARETLVAYLLKDSNLFQEVIRCAAIYQSNAQKGLEELSNSADAEVQKQLKDSPWTLKLAKDEMTHEEHVTGFIDFIEFLIINSRSYTLSFDNLNNLFETFVTNAVTPFESKHFFIFLTKENDNSRTRERRFLLDEKLRPQVFSNIMCNEKMLSCERLNFEGFHCFKTLFINVNSQLQLLKVDTQQQNYSVSDPNKLQGISTLWSLTIVCANETVKQHSRNFLVDLHQKVHSNDPKKKQNVLATFMAKINELLSKLSAEDKNISQNEQIDHRLNWIKLIRTFIVRFDYEHVKEEDPMRFRRGKEPDKDEIKIDVTLQPDNTKAEVTVNQNQLLWQLIIQIGKAFKLRPSEFLIKTNKGTVSQDVYDHKISNYDIQKLPIVRIPEETLEIENPRRFIAQDKSFIQQLVRLLDALPDEEPVVRGIIGLIEIFPVNKEMKTVIEESLTSTVKDKMDWNQAFHWDTESDQRKPSPHTFLTLLILQDLLVYSLPIPDVNGESTQHSQQLMNLEESQAKNGLLAQFVKKGGLTHLIKMFTLFDKSNIDSSTLSNKSLTLFLKLIKHIFSPKLFSDIENTLTGEIYAQLFTENLQIIQTFIMKTREQQSEEETGHRQLKFDINLISLSLHLFNRLVALRPSLIVLFYKSPDIDETLKQLFLYVEAQHVQQKVCESLLEVSKQLDTIDFDQNSVRPAFFLIKLILTNFVPEALQHQKATGRMREMFQLSDHLFQQTQVCQNLHLVEPINQLVSKFCELTQNRPILEITASEENEDCILTGLFSLLKNIIQQRPEALECFQDEKNGYMNFLLHDCLFHKDTKRAIAQKGTAMYPTCKTSNSRQNCLLLLKELSTANQTALRMFSDYMRETIYNDDVSAGWRTPQKTNWAIQVVDMHERSQTGFVGLKNIACICYLNSIMQQLYMIPAFRKAILEVEDENYGKEPNSENVIYQMKRIFGGLMELEKQFYNPKGFLRAFKDIDGSPIDPTIQKDADEFFNMLIDRIENLIKGSKEEKIMKNLFYGCFANEFICEGCPHYKEREEPFMAIVLQVKNKKSILESLETFVEGEMLDGDNAYFCEQCDTKRDTLKRCTIKRLPNVLFFELKRFEFDFDTMSKIKVNDFCEFPTELDMKEYSQAQIARDDLMKKMEKENWTKEDLTEDQLIVLNREIAPEYYKYKLKGVTVHDGMADYGHYYSFIKDREGPDGKDNWYCFNDTIVTAFDAKDIPQETFGGEVENFSDNVNNQNDPAMQQIMMSQGKTKKNNAYILIYERDEFIDQDRFNEFTEDIKQVLTCAQKGEGEYTKLSQQMFSQCRTPTTVSTQIQITPTIHESILEKNRNYWTTKFIFNRHFIQQINEIFEKATLQQNQDYEAARGVNLQIVNSAIGTSPIMDQTEILKFLITFSFTVAFRATNRQHIPNFVKLIRAALKKNVAVCVWLLEAMSEQDLIKEFFIECPIQDMGRFTAGLIKTAMETIYPFEKEKIMRYIEWMDMGQHTDYVRQTQSKFISNQQHSTAAIHTACPAAEVITLKSAPTSDLPMLIIFMNTILHLQSSKYMMGKLIYGATFFQIISHFAELGQSARLYLLKCKTLGRLLSTFLFNNLRSEEHIVNLQTMVPLFSIKKKQMFLRPVEVNAEAKIGQKEKREVISSLQPPFTFLVHAISLLARSCEYVKPNQGGNVVPGRISPFSLGGHHTLDQDELDMLINELSNRTWLTKLGCEYPLFKNSLAQMYAHIAFDNQQFSKLYIEYIFATINANDYSVVRRFERPLLLLVQLPDDYQKERIKSILNYLYEQAKKSTQYWKFCDQLTDLTFKLTVRCPHFAAEMGKNRQFIRMIEQITKENPSFPITQNKCLIFKDGKVDWNKMKNRPGGMTISQNHVDNIKTYTKNRLESMVKIVNTAAEQEEKGEKIHRPERLEPIVDSDSDVYDTPHKFKTGDLVDINGKQFQWTKGKVDCVLEEMLKVTTQGLKYNKSVWIERESPNIAFHKTHTENEKEQHYEFFKELNQYSEPVQQQNPNVAVGQPVGQQRQNQQSNRPQGSATSNNRQRNNRN